ncbi:MAG: type III secretion system export apparatus subunit SctT [Geminicoccaceae bacterium]|nr:type III secretion system export apparatus subunit SctT [Geminicoccaceae bacterium]MCB9942271.1 type III secretion system export apparatus subunit SctT [Geminicoccaceae bacterium]
MSRLLTDAFAGFDLAALLWAVALAAARMTAMMSILPLMGRSGLQGFVRNGVVVAMSLPVVPMVYADIGIHGLPGGLALMGLLLKEGFIGLLIGLVVSFPIFAMQMAGDVLDAERGATMAIDASESGNEASLMGAFLSMLIMAYMLVSGAFLAILDGYVESLVIWPPLSALPEFSSASGGQVFLLLDRLMLAAVLIAAPMMIAMVLTEISLAITTRFAPSLNVFVLGLGVKSLVLFLIIPLYMSTLGSQAGNLVSVIAGIIPQMRTFLAGMAAGGP